MTVQEAQNNIGQQFKWLGATGGIFGSYDTIRKVKSDGTIEGDRITCNCNDARLKGDEPEHLKTARLKKAGTLVMLAAFIFCSCDTSEGTKFGTLQKVSHKTGICNWYAIEIAFEGGRAVNTSEKSSSYSNSQEFTIDKAAFDTLQQYIGSKIAASYHDRGFANCEDSKLITSIVIK